MSQPDQFVAQFFIEINGSPVSSDLMNDLYRVEVDQSLHLPACATIELYDPELKWVDNAMFSVGAEVVVKAAANPSGGLAGTTVQLFKGVLAAIEPEFLPDSSYSTLVVRAYDKSYLLHRGNESKAYNQMTDSDIIQQIGRNAGLTVQATATTVVHEHVMRSDMSDWDFLKLLANRNGFVAVVDTSGTLQAKAPDQLGFGEVTAEYGKDLLEFRPMLSIAGQVNQVQVNGWDRAQKQTVSGAVTSAKLASTAIGVGKRGYVLAQSAHSAKTLHVTDAWPTQSAAEKAAAAVLDRISSNDVTGEGKAVGNPNIKAGCKLKVQKVGTRFSGQYLVTRARHRITPGDSYTTEFWIGGMNSGTVASLVSTPSPGAAPAFSRTNPALTLMTALVTNVKDKDNRWRVKLKYPQIADSEESNWAPVVSVGAGKDRGLLFLPEVNDEVLVGFVNGDINYPYVLGGLWNGKDAAPETQGDITGSGTVDIRTLKTRAGHILRFTDKSGSEKIEVIDKAKNSIVIDSSNNTITITAGKDIVLKATGDVKISGANVSIESKAKVELKGVNADIAGSAQTKITGGMVMIN